MKREARTERFQLMMEPSLVKRVDDWRYANRVTSRALAIRHLIDIGLDGAEKANGPAEAATSPSHDQNHTSQKDGGVDV